MSVLVPVSSASSARTIALPVLPAGSGRPWLPSLAAASAVLVSAVAVGALRGGLDPVVASIAAASAGAAHLVVVLLAQRAGDFARRRWLDAVDETEAACEVQLASRQRSLLDRWPPSADLVERLRRGEPPPVVGAPAFVVLGTGAVASGLALVGDAPVEGDARERVAELRSRVEILPDGPLCVDAAGGVHVTGPPLLVESLAGGWRAQLRHRGASPDLVTWDHEVAEDEPGGGAASDVEAACVVEVTRRGAVVVVRRDGVPCSVPVVPSWTSSFDAPAGPRTSAVSRGRA